MPPLGALRRWPADEMAARLFNFVRDEAVMLASSLASKQPGTAAVGAP